MSEAHNEHQSIIRTPKQLIAAVAGFFLVIVIGIILLVSYATSGKLTGAGTESQNPEAVAQRLQPVAEQGYTLKDVNAPKTLQTGEAVYTSTCAACHGTGAAGAPKFGDAAAWGPRIKQGYDTLVQHALQGIRAMPAKGGNPDLDNIEVARAVAYMANKGGASFKEPEAPAAAPAGAATTAAAAAMPGANAPALAAAPAANAVAPEAAAPAMPAAQPKPAAADAGKALFTSTCSACHATGVAGAPKFGDKTAWAPRLKQGTNVLYEHALKGFQGKSGMMPPKGGSTASDEDVKSAVDYMATAAK
jgi:cytochrome c5